MKMIISMPEDDRQQFLKIADAILDQAEKYTNKCIDILVSEYGADRESIKRDIFYDGAVGRLFSGKTLPAPADGVKEAVRIYRAALLGLVGRETAKESTDD